MATTPPKKIIKALYDYNSQGPGELSFKMGDFLYVVGHEEDEEWYEACDPPSNLRGMVPVAYFTVVDNASAKTHKHSSSTASQGRSSQGRAPLYGVVLYDFVAERPDELQASAGESIIVIAQSNEEWFVAKPIGRLGGPGLIPVSFIEIRDLATGRAVENIEDAVRKAGVPKVEEWKRMAAEYKASSIPLGKFDEAGGGMSDPHHHHYQHQQQMQQRSSGGSSHRHSASGYVVSASVDRYAFDGGRYWYLVVAELSNGRYRNLCRYYQDFYDFQIRLLDEFPEEAGRTGKQRTLPFMPGPLTYVNDSISSQRRANLDDYVRNLTMMPTYISRSSTVQQLFALRQGDIETPYLTNTMPQPPTRSSQHSSMVDSVSSVTTGNTSSMHESIHEAPSQLPPPTTATTATPAGGGGHQRLNSQSTVTDNYHQHTRQQTADSVATGHSSKPSDAGSPGKGGDSAFIKVKIFHDDDLIAIRVPASVTFSNLEARIAERLSLDTVALLYKDNEQFDEIVDDESLARALAGRNKLVLYAK